MSDIIRRRILASGAKSGGSEQTSVVEYEYPKEELINRTDRYLYSFGPNCITEINWPEGIKHIFKYSFCDSNITLDTLNSMPESVEVIGEYAFYHCDKITGSLVLPSSLVILGNNNFYKSGISSVTFNGTNLTLGTYCFYNCSSLSTINFPENFLFVIYGNYCFQSTPWYTNKSNGNIYIGKNYFQYKGTMPSNTNITLDSGTLSISAYAFQSKTQLKSITIPNSVKFIGPYAFSGCTGLTSISIPESLDDTYFAVDPDYVHIGATSTADLSAGGIIKGSPFYSSACTGITTINYNATSFYNLVGSSTTYSLLYSSGLPNVTTVNIGSNVQVIPQSFIYNFKKITSITLPNSITRIGKNAFQNCTGLTSITIPENVQYIEQSGGILNGCTGITTINYNATSCVRVSNTTSLDNLFPTAATNTYTSIWGTLSNVTTVNIGNNVQVIPGGFLSSGQANVTSITIPSSVTTIAYGAFYASKLTSIDLPASVTKIGNYAFYNCTAITGITIRSTTPPALDSSYTYTFPTSTQNSSFKIYVPSESVQTYKTTSKWSNWSSKIQAIPS